MTYWQAILVIVVVALVVLFAVGFGASLADKSRLRAILDKRQEWEPPPDGH